jgi:DNA-directed RNA polymerase subunit RPC12/RpoP
MNARRSRAAAGRRPDGRGDRIIVATEQLSAFQKAPEDASYKCGQCGNVLCLKKGQLLPPCPKCGHRQFARTEAS